jgi:hypothetical protein
MAVARPTESASITQPHAYVNSIAVSHGNEKERAAARPDLLREGLFGLP